MLLVDTAGLPSILEHDNETQPRLAPLDGVIPIVCFNSTCNDGFSLYMRWPGDEGHMQ